MPVFDQRYQHWQGTLSGHACRWLAITRQGVRVQRQNRWVRIVLPLLWLMGLPGELLDAPRTLRTAIWTLGYHYFFRVELFFAMILVLLVGPGLISQDLRFNAIPLYFSRPLRRLDYFVGKLAVIGAFLSAVTIVPAVLAFVLGILFSLDVSVIQDTWRLLLASVGYGAVIVLSAGTLMLALSALSRNSRAVAALWVGIWFVSSVVAGALGGLHRSDRFGLTVTVCHDPTGCSKWNPIEHRLFSQISLNWAGQPLRTFETMLGYLRDTTTTTGLTVTAQLLEGIYQTGKKIADTVMKTLHVIHHAVCPQWNYTIHPRVEGALAT